MWLARASGAATVGKAGARCYGLVVDSLDRGHPAQPGRDVGATSKQYIGGWALSVRRQRAHKAKIGELGRS